MSSQDSASNDFSEKSEAQQKEQQLLKNDEESRDSTVQSGVSLEDEEEQDEALEDYDEEEDVEEIEDVDAEENEEHDPTTAEVNGNAKKYKRAHANADEDEVVDSDSVGQKKKKADNGESADQEAVTANE